MLVPCFDFQKAGRPQRNRYIVYKQHVTPHRSDRHDSAQARPNRNIENSPVPVASFSFTFLWTKPVNFGEVAKSASLQPSIIEGASEQSAIKSVVQPQNQNQHQGIRVLRNSPLQAINKN